MVGRNWRRNALCAAMLAAATLLIVYAMRGLFPFGGRSVLTRDMYQQNVPVLFNFRDVLAGEANLF